VVIDIVAPAPTDIAGSATHGRWGSGAAGSSASRGCAAPAQARTLPARTGSARAVLVTRRPAGRAGAAVRARTAASGAARATLSTARAERASHTTQPRSASDADRWPPTLGTTAGALAAGCAHTAEARRRQPSSAARGEPGRTALAPEPSVDGGGIAGRQRKGDQPHQHRRPPPDPRLMHSKGTISAPLTAKYMDEFAR
jgi:hypothetical protein